MVGEPLLGMVELWVYDSIYQDSNSGDYFYAFASALQYEFYEIVDLSLVSVYLDVC